MAFRFENGEIKKLLALETFEKSYVAIEKLLSGCAFVEVASFSFATVFAQGKPTALFAFVFYHHAFFYEVYGFSGVFYGVEIGFVNIAEKLLVQTIKVARIQVAVAFYYVLVGAVAVHSALFGSLEFCKFYHVVEGANRCVIASHIVGKVKGETLV